MQVHKQNLHTLPQQPQQYQQQRIDNAKLELIIASKVHIILPRQPRVTRIQITRREIQVHQTARTTNL